MNYLIEGSDGYLVNEKIRKIKQAELADISEMNDIDFSLGEHPLAELIAEANQLPFLSDMKAITVYNGDLNPLSADPDGLSEADYALLVSYLKDPCASTCLIFDLSVHPLSGRSSAAKQLAKLCSYIKIPPLDEPMFRQRVAQDLKKHQVAIRNDALSELLDRLPIDLENWQQELSKLATYPGELTAAAVRELVIRPLFGSGSKDTLYFTNALLGQDLRKTLEMWNDLTQQTKDYYQLIGLVASQLRFLYQVKYLEGKHYSSAAIAERLKANPYRVTKTLEITGHYRIDDISRLLYELSILDTDIKSGKVTDKKGFELFLIKAAGGRSLWSR